MLGESACQKSYDVMVIGGGLAGVTAAIAASRLGSKVALLQHRPVLGGNSSSEIRVPVGGAAALGKNRYARETGIIEELRVEFGYRDPIPIEERNLHSGNKRIWDLILEEWVDKEENLDLFLDTMAMAVEMSGLTRIKSIKAYQGGTNRLYILPADIFIDATGDGIIAAKAGANFRMGREGRKEHGEGLAPESPDEKTLGSSIMFTICNVGYPVSLRAPAWAKEYVDCSDLPPHKHILDTKMGFWWIEYGGEMSTIEDNDRIRKELLSIVMGVWDHIKNHCEIKDKVANYAIDWIGSVVGKRESRRVVGDYILDQNDLLSQKLFPDRVAYGGWAIDLHPPSGIGSKELPAMQVFLPGLYSIPFRALYSQNVENLMMAGRDISVTHVALGSTRVMGTCAIIGQAVGTAAHFCKKHKVNPRRIYEKHIEELQQQLLKDDCYIIGLKNEDSSDIALESKVLASSSLPLKVTDPNGFQELNCARAQMFPVSKSWIKTIEVYLRSDRGQNTEIQLGLRQADAPEDFSSCKDIVTCTRTVPAGKSAWVSFEINREVNPNKLYWIWLPQCPKIFWGYHNEELVCTRRGKYNNEKDSWEVVLGYQDEEHAIWVPDVGTFCFKISPTQEPYDGSNVVSGISRPELRPNIWISDPDQGFPQYLDLVFDQPQNISTVYLTFDTNLNCHGSSHLQAPAEECVKDYTLYRFEKPDWIPIVEVCGNYQRHRIHRLTEPISTERIRLEVRATNGADTARVYEIRAY